MRGPWRVLRNIAAAALIIGLAAGTVVWQTDDTWPLAQMRMFPGGSESAIAIVIIDAELKTGRHKEMDPFAFHLKRAEIEGQMDRIRKDPDMLGDLARVHNASVAHDREIVGIRLVRREYSPAGAAAPTARPIETTLVRWHA